MDQKKKRNKSRIVLLGCMIFLGCAQAKPMERPLPEVEKVGKRPVTIEKVPKEALPRLKPFIDSKILEEYLKQVEFDLANLKRDEEEAQKKGFPDSVLIQISHEKERLSKRKKTIEDIQGIQEVLELIEGFEDQVRLQKVVTQKLFELSKIYPRFSVDLSEMPLPAKKELEPYAKVKDFEKEIEKAYTENRYEELIASYEAFAGQYPKVKISPEILSRYAISLHKRGDKIFAIEKLKEALEDEAFKIDVQQLRYLLESWLFETGSYEEAIEVYKVLEKEQEKQKRWMELAGIKARMIESATKRRASVEEKEMATLPEPPVEEKKEEKTLPPQEKKEEPSIAAAHLHPTELNALDVPPEERKLKADMAILEEANRLYDRAQYHQAIKLYQRLAGTFYEEEGKKRIQEAMDRYTQMKRKEAVEIFLQVKKSPDQEEQKALLYKVLEMLRGINKRYPTNRYAEKVKANIEVVIKEIKKVDPNFTE